MKTTVKSILTGKSVAFIVPEIYVIIEVRESRSKLIKSLLEHKRTGKKEREPQVQI